MNELQTSNMKTPIEIALGVDENGMTTAKALYEFLSGEKSNFSKWAKRNIEQNEFYEENKDCSCGCRVKKCTQNQET